MNTPNKLTVLRVILVPVFLLFLFVDAIPLHWLWALVIFAAASITDTLDGHLARKNGQVTTFGKFLDPLADKILVLSAMIAFIELNLCGAIPVILMIAREFMVTSLRLVAVSGSGKVIAAGNLGKVKTVVQMVSVILIMVLAFVDGMAILPFALPLYWIGEGLMWLSAVLSTVSGAEYIWKNREAITQFK